MVQTLNQVSDQVRELLYDLKFIFHDICPITDGSGLIRRVELRIAIPRLVQVEAYIKQMGELQSFIGSVSDPLDDNSSEFDYIDCVGNSFDGCLLSCIRQLGQHYV